MGDEDEDKRWMRIIIMTVIMITIIMRIMVIIIMRSCCRG